MAGLEKGIGLNPEPLYAALAARVAAAASLTAGVSRRMPPSNQVGPAEQSCAFVPAGKHTPINTPGGVPMWRIDTVIFVYARTDDPGQAPSSMLNPLVQDIEAQLRWQAADGLALGKGPGTWGTLGKLCEHCEITSVEYAEGIPDGQGVAFIHVQILAVAAQ